MLRIFTALALGREASAADLAILNRCRRACHIGPEADGFGWLWPGEDETLARVLWPPAQSAAELLASGDYRRVRQCACQGCYRLFLYQNSRRLWCDPNTCGNRAKGRRHAQSWRRVRKQQEHERLVDSARRIEEFRQWCAEQGKVADFDKEDPEFGVWSDGWGEKLKKELKSRAE